MFYRLTCLPVPSFYPSPLMQWTFLTNRSSWNLACFNFRFMPIQKQKHFSRICKHSFCQMVYTNSECWTTFNYKRNQYRYWIEGQEKLNLHIYNTRLSQIKCLLLVNLKLQEIKKVYWGPSLFFVFVKKRNQNLFYCQHFLL